MKYTHQNLMGMFLKQFLYDDDSLPANQKEPLKIDLNTQTLS